MRFAFAATLLLLASSLLFAAPVNPFPPPPHIAMTAPVNPFPPPPHAAMTAPVNPFPPPPHVA